MRNIFTKLELGVELVSKEYVQDSYFQVSRNVTSSHPVHNRHKIAARWVVDLVI